MTATAVAPRLAKGVVVDLQELGISESYIEQFITDDPAILGLDDDVSVIESQRRQGKLGRLDLLMEDGSGKRRYEIELMLGTVDESHLIRTIEYWDIERRSYPAYEHCAVLVAENITARFLNVITLFSESVPIIVIQMNAVKVDDKAALTFMTLVDSRKLLRKDDDPPTSPSTDRADWESRVGNGILRLVGRRSRFYQ
jgi:hypothetical protein